MGRKEISPLIKRWLPNATAEELAEAQENYERTLLALYYTFLRLEREANRRAHDKSGEDDNVSPLNKEV